VDLSRFPFPLLALDWQHLDVILMEVLSRNNL
jgi:hypothetical protein